MKLLPTLLAATLLPLTLYGFASNAAPAPTAAPAAVDTVAYEIDGAHSGVMFRIQHFVAPFWGRFNKLSGKVAWDNKAPEKSSIELSIDTASIDTNNKGRDEHLCGPDFFSAKEFPTITFKSKSVKKKSDKVLELTGDLTLHGTTKSVTVDVDVVGEGDTMPQMGYRAGFEATFSIKRSDFGVKGFLPNIGDDVRIVVALECAKAK